MKQQGVRGPDNKKRAVYFCRHHHNTNIYITLSERSQESFHACRDAETYFPPPDTVYYGGEVLTEAPESRRDDRSEARV